MTDIPLLRSDDPLLLFGGCYSNLQATEALLRAAKWLEIPPRRIICTGDVVAYCADAVATARLVRDIGMHVVMGNCEESLGESAGDCGCGFEPGSACDRLSAAWFTHAAATLGADDRAWMRGLPRRIDLAIGGRRIAVVHGSVPRINEFVFASASDAALTRHIADAHCDGVIGGHCGLPFSRVVAGRVWHNTGAIGMPANDGTPRGWFSLLLPRDDGLDIRHLPLSYNHAAAAAAMRRAGLPCGYADALETGLWPSLDVLPPAERAQTGVPLRPRTLVWPSRLKQPA